MSKFVVKPYELGGARFKCFNDGSNVITFEQNGSVKFILTCKDVELAMALKTMLNASIRSVETPGD